MQQQELTLGVIRGRDGKRFGAEFRVPVDIAGRRNAFIGTSGCGKTCAVAKLEEELLRVGQPFTVLDTVGVHLGLRAKKDGSPSGLPVVIFGGKRGDLPINHEEIGFGARLAELTLSSNIPIVIDLSKTPLSYRFRIVAEFASTLMENDSEDVRHIIVEETPEFIPQELQHKGQDACKAHMLRLVTLGRNNGYTVTLVGQRWATIDKTALAMIENFVIMRTIVKDDRKRLKEVFDEVAPDTDLSECFSTMAKLEDGEAWFFSPQWLKRFERMKFNERFTFHPGETRKVGVKLQQVNMGDVQKFVEQIGKALSRTTVAPSVLKTRMVGDAMGLGTKTGRMKTSEPNLSNVPRRIALSDSESRKVEKLIEEAGAREQKTALENHQLNAQVKNLEGMVSRRDTILDGLRKVLKPQYDALRQLFDGDAAEIIPQNGPADASKFEGFFRKASKVGAKKMLEVMIQRRRVHKNQLQSLANVSKNTYYKGRAWMLKSRIMSLDGEVFVLSEMP